MFSSLYRSCDFDDFDRDSDHYNEQEASSSASSLNDKKRLLSKKSILGDPGDSDSSFDTTEFSKTTTSHKKSQSSKTKEVKNEPGSFHIIILVYYHVRKSTTSAISIARINGILQNIQQFLFFKESLRWHTGVPNGSSSSEYKESNWTQNS